MQRPRLTTAGLQAYYPVTVYKGEELIIRAVQSKWPENKYTPTVHKIKSTILWIPDCLWM